MSCWRTIDVVVGLVDEADQAVGEVLLPADLLRQRARGQAGADDQQPFLEMRIVREAVEREPPRQRPRRRRRRAR